MKKIRKITMKKNCELKKQQTKKWVRLKLGQNLLRKILRKRWLKVQWFWTRYQIATCMSWEVGSSTPVWRYSNLSYFPLAFCRRSLSCHNFTTGLTQEGRVACTRASSIDSLSLTSSPHIKQWMALTGDAAECLARRKRPHAKLNKQ